VKSYEKLMPDSIAKFEIIGRCFYLIKNAGNQIKIEEKVATKVVLSCK
jgi:hypothetical protein